MTPDQMLEWTNKIGALACSWPVVVLFLLVAFRQPLRRFIEAMSSVPGSFSLKFGSAELKRDIAQIVTSMNQLHTEVQHDMREVAATSQRLEQILNAAERSQKHNHHMTGLMSDLYLFEIDSLLQAPEVDLSPEQRQRLITLREGIRDIRSELASTDVRELSAGAQETTTAGVVASSGESGQRTETVDGLSGKKEALRDEVLVVLIRHGSKAKSPDDDRIAEAVKSIRQSCQRGSDPEDKWPFPQDWTWAADDCDQRARAVTDLLTPLDDDGEKQTQQLALWLRPLLSPLQQSKTVFLSSYYRHAQDMANSISRQCAAPELQPRVQSLRSLTPNSSTETLEDILAEAEQQGIELLKQRLVVCIGHEARLSHLFTRLTGTRTRPFNHANVVAVSADSWTDLLAGTGMQKFRWPVADHQEQALRSKVQSKMTVATFLAGFVAAVLFSLLLAGIASPLGQVAGILITASLALFIAVVYVYDRLSMPEGFWVDEDRPSRFQWRPGNQEFQRNLLHQGPLYAYMVWTWEAVFTPAVILALVGFLVLVVEIENFWLLIGIAAALAAVGLYYAATRPRLGTD